MGMVFKNIEYMNGGRVGSRTVAVVCEAPGVIIDNKYITGN
jgi:hypothetical protein